MDLVGVGEAYPANWGVARVDDAINPGRIFSWVTFQDGGNATQSVGLTPEWG